MGGGEKNGTAFLRELGGRSAIRIPEIIFVTGNYDELPTAEILSIDMPIALFLEKDFSFPDSLLEPVQLVMRRIEGRMRYDPKDLFGDVFIKARSSTSQVRLSEGSMPATTRLTSSGRSAH